MKPRVQTLLILSFAMFAFADAQIEEASAQGPIIRRMRDRLNDGKPLLPFVGDIEKEAKDFASRLKPASKSPSSAKKPTLAKEPTPTKRPTESLTPLARKKESGKFPPIKLQSGGAARKDTKSAGMSDFGLLLKKVGEKFIVVRLDPEGNAAESGIRRGDVITAIGGAGLQVIEEFEAIEKAMRGGDQVEFEVSRRGAKPEKVLVRYGAEAEPDDSEIDLAPEITPPSSRERSGSSATGSGLKSVFEGADKPSAGFKPIPNRVESLQELDFPALDGGK